MNWLDLDLEDIDTPAILVSEDLVIKNIEAAIKRVGSVDRFRPHVKTHKTLEVAKMQMDQGIHKFKCATIAEAEMLGLAGAKDVMIAYQPQGPKLKRIVDLIKTYEETTFSFLIDNIGTSRTLAQYFTNEFKAVVFVDINDGHDRTGISPSNASILIRELSDVDYISIAGLHCYDGHIRMPDLEERVKQGNSAFQEVMSLRKELEKLLDRKVELVAGGSPSFSVHADDKEVTCSPGTFVFWDERYSSNYKELPFQKAAVLATRVISKINNHRYCLDLGHKSVASEFPFPRVKFLEEMEIIQKGHSEEHLIIETTLPNALRVGQLLLAFPMHVCPTVALYDHLEVWLENGQHTQWPVVARNRSITI